MSVSPKTEHGHGRAFARSVRPAPVWSIEPRKSGARCHPYERALPSERISVVVVMATNVVMVVPPNMVVMAIMVVVPADMVVMVMMPPVVVMVMMVPPVVVMVVLGELHGLRPTCDQAVCGPAEDAGRRGTRRDEQSAGLEHDGDGERGQHRRRTLEHGTLRWSRPPPSPLQREPLNRL